MSLIRNVSRADISSASCTARHLRKITSTHCTYIRVIEVHICFIRYFSVSRDYRALTYGPTMFGGSTTRLQYTFVVMRAMIHVKARVAQAHRYLHGCTRVCVKYLEDLYVRETCTHQRNRLRFFTTRALRLTMANEN